MTKKKRIQSPRFIYGKEKTPRPHSSPGINSHSSIQNPKSKIQNRMTQDVFKLTRPKGNILLGNLLDLGQDPLGFLTRCVRDFGEIVPLQLGLRSACAIANPNYIEQILKDPELFVKSQGFRVLKTMLGEGLLTSEGESWFRQRHLIQPIFHQKRIVGYGEIIVNYAEQMLKTWQDGEVRDVQADMMRLTLSIVMKSIFNTEMDEGEAQNIAHALEVSMYWFDSKRKQGFLLWKWFPSPENIRYRHAIAQMDRTIYSIIRQRRISGEDPKDLLSMLMQAQDQDDNSQMNDKQLRDEVATLMLAGHETTANALSWTWMLLSQNPQVATKLRAELQAVLGGRTPTVQDIPHLQYTERAIKESMRLYPPVALLARETARNCQIGDYEVPAKCTILICQWVMHRNPKYFENPEVFNPDRWAGDLEKQLPKGVYFPFGDGSRTCIGKGFAMMEAVLLLATIAQKFQLQLIPDFPIVPQPSITLRPKYGIKVKVKQLD